MIGDLNIGGGDSSFDIHGIIKSYKAYSGTISANTFVQFVNETSPTTYTEKTINSTSGTGERISATKCGTNDVIIFHSSESSESATLKAVVCQISSSSSNITVGSDTVISSNTGTGSKFSATQLYGSTIFVAYSSSNTNYYLRGIVCTVSGTTITVGTATALADTQYYGSLIKVANLSSSSSDLKVFISHSGTPGTNSYALKGLVCTISGTTITKGTDTNLTTNYKRTGSIAPLSSTKVLIKCDSGDSNYYLAGLVCTISGTTISIGTKTTLVNANTNTAYCGSVAKISSTKGFFIHGSNGSRSDAQLKAIVCTISGTTITTGSDTTISSTGGSIGEKSSVTYLASSTVNIAHQSDYVIKGLVLASCTVSGTSISSISDTILDNSSYAGETTSIVPVTSSDRPFVVHSGYATKFLSSYLRDISQVTTKIKTSTTKIDGITKTQATTSTSGQIYVPEN